VTNTPDWVEIARRPTRDAEHPEDVVSRLRGPSALRRRAPDHLDPLHRQGPPRRHPPPPGHRQSHRRDRCAQRPAVLPTLPHQDRRRRRGRSPRAIAEVNATRWVNIHVETDTVESFRQAKRGRPGPNTAYIKVSRTTLRIRFAVDETQVAHDAASDGMWPLITNDRT
jgi:hypothetical protein